MARAIRVFDDAPLQFHEGVYPAAASPADPLVQGLDCGGVGHGEDHP